MDSHGLAERHAVDALAAAINEAAFVQLVKDAEDAAGAVALLHAVLLRVRCQLAQTGRLAAQGVDVLHGEVHPTLLCHGQQVQHGVG